MSCRIVISVTVKSDSGRMNVAAKVAEGDRGVARSCRLPFSYLTFLVRPSHFSAMRKGISANAAGLKTRSSTSISHVDEVIDFESWRFAGYVRESSGSVQARSQSPLSKEMRQHNFINSPGDAKLEIWAIEVS